MNDRTQTRRSTYFDLGTGLQRSFESNCASLYQALRQGLRSEDGRELPVQCWQESLACLAATRAWLSGWQALADTQHGYLAQAWLRQQHELGVQHEQIGAQMFDLWLALLQRLQPEGPFALFDRLLAWPAEPGAMAASDDERSRPAAAKRPVPARPRAGEAV